MRLLTGVLLLALCGSWAVAVDVISTYAGDGFPGFSDDDSATSSSLHNPGGVSLNSLGNLLISDTYNNRIRLVTTLGIITTIAGSGATGATSGSFGGDGGVASSAELNNPSTVEIDSSGIDYTCKFMHSQCTFTLLSS